MWPFLQEAIGYHCFRGMLTPDTEVFLSEATDKSWSLPGAGPAHHVSAACG